MHGNLAANLALSPCIKVAAAGDSKAKDIPK
jgi:hypothetical protein